MVRKAVIPVAGLGTRMLPASKAIPKEMLPLVDRPVIAHVVDEVVRAGIKEVILVTSAGKGAIEDYFDRDAALEQALANKGKDSLLRQLTDILPEDVSIASVRQGSPRGLGHAVYCAAPLVGDEPFAVLLPDVLLDRAGGEEDLARMVTCFEKEGAAQILVEAVPDEDVNKYGIADIPQSTLNPGESAPLKGLVEKPEPEDAPSNLAVVGRYVLPGRIMPLLAATGPGAGGEIQLTDAIDTLIQESPVYAFAMTGRSFDCGNKAGYLEAFFHFALRHPDTAAMARQIAARVNSEDSDAH